MTTLLNAVVEAITPRLYNRMDEYAIKHVARMAIKAAFQHARDNVSGDVAVPRNDRRPPCRTGQGERDVRGYWRILIMDGKVMPFAVGTYNMHMQMHFPPTDGKPYLTSDELPAELERAERRAKRPRQLFPWQERARPESEVAK